MTYHLKTLLVAALLVVVGLMPAATANAQDGSVKIEIFRAGFIVGVGGGHGTLHYKGKGYRLDVSGVSLGATIGLSSAELIGQVYNLKKPEDIAGTYSAISGTAVLAGGVSSADLQNSNGVRLQVSGMAIGVELSLDLGGMVIKLQ